MSDAAGAMAPSPPDSDVTWEFEINQAFKIEGRSIVVIGAFRPDDTAHGDDIAELIVDGATVFVGPIGIELVCRPGDKNYRRPFDSLVLPTAPSKELFQKGHVLRNFNARKRDS